MYSSISKPINTCNTFYVYQLEIIMFVIISKYNKGHKGCNFKTNITSGANIMTLVR